MSNYPMNERHSPSPLLAPTCDDRLIWKIALTMLQKARQRQQTQDFKEQYATRAGIEDTLSQGRTRIKDHS